MRWVDVVEGATLEPQISRRNKMWSTRWKPGVYALLVYERFQSFFILSGAEASVDAQLAFHLRRDSSASCVRCRLCSSPWDDFTFSQRVKASAFSIVVRWWAELVPVGLRDGLHVRFFTLALNPVLWPWLVDLSNPYSGFQNMFGSIKAFPTTPQCSSQI